MKIKVNFQFWLLVLSSCSFLNPFGILSNSVSKLFFYIICFFILFLNYKKKSFCKIPLNSYCILLGGITMSIVMALLFQNQTFTLSFISCLPFLFGYFSLFLFAKMNLSIEKVMQYVKYLAIIGMLSYVINMITFPNMIFGEEVSEVDMSRGVARIGVPMLHYIILYYFYQLSLWQKFKSRLSLLWICTCFTFILLSVTRQLILLSLFLGLIMILSKVSIYRKIIIIMITTIFVLFVLPNIPIVNKLIEISEEQNYNNKYNKEDIRITAWKYYTNDNQTNDLTRLFGNGVPSEWKSPWGIKFAKAVYVFWGGNGCYTVDVGWAGFYYYFGIFSTFGLLMLLIKGIKKNIHGSYKFISYYLLLVFISSIASAPILFYTQIIVLCLALYMAFYNKKLATRHNGRDSYIKL